MLITISLTSCFRVTEVRLSIPVVKAPDEKTVTVKVAITKTSMVELKTIVVKIVPDAWYYIGYYNLYPPPYRSSLRYRQSYIKGRRHWWRDNIEPMFWPKPEPKLVYIIERGKMIPRDVKESIDRYVDDGCPTGSFLCAVLGNNLFEAAAKADVHNRLWLVDICEYIYNHTPNTCHGSATLVTNWLRFHRTQPEIANEAASADREKRAKYYE